MMLQEDIVYLIQSHDRYKNQSIGKYGHNMKYTADLDYKLHKWYSFRNLYDTIETIKKYLI